MYAGHFALVLVLVFYYPGVNAFLLAIGVGLLDIVFAFLAYFNLERISINPKAGFLGVDLYCPYSHSLVGALIISFLWACWGLNDDTFLPLFLSSFSHFILDWFVHNRDMELYPHSHVCIGGTECWSRYPYAAYYFELLLCIVCSIEAVRQAADILTFNTRGLLLTVAIGYVFYLHYQRRPSMSGRLAGVLKNVSKERQGLYISNTFIISFIVPAISLGLVLHLFMNQ